MEQFIWVVFTLTSLSFAGYMGARYSSRYFQYDVRTEIRQEDKQIIEFPSVVILHEDSFLKKLFSYNNNSIDSQDRAEESTKDDLLLPDYTSFLGDETLGGDDFLEGTDIPLSTNESDAEPDFWKKRITELNVSYNKRGDNPIEVKETDNYAFIVDTNISVSSRAEHLQIDIKSKTLDKIELIFQSKTFLTQRNEIAYISQKGSFLNIARGMYDIYVEKTETSRLAAPYVSNCFNDSNIFSDIYSVESCQEACVFNKMYEKCDDVIDPWKKYLKNGPKPSNSSSKKKNKKKRRNYASRADCLFWVLHNAQHHSTKNCICPTACLEHTYTFDVLPDTTENLNNSWRIRLHSNGRKIIRITEVPAYTIEDYLGSLGGFIGLCLGASLLSLVEILMYTIIFIASSIKLLIRKKQRSNTNKSC